MKKLIYIIMLLSSALVYGQQLTIGVLVTPPYAVYTGTGKHYFGFAVDLMDNICKQIQADCTYKPMHLNTELDALKNGTVDLAFTQIPISDDSTGQFLFSLPYLISDGQFLTLTGTNINKVTDIKDKRIGVLSVTLNEVLKESHFNNGQIKLFSTFPDLIAGLENNDVDVVFINNHVGQYLVNNAMIDVKLVGDKIPIGEGYGILGLKTNKELIDKVNSALLKMEEDGSYLKIYSLYFGEKI
jgi:ABC-type amino acid transport substrate-binding protein